LATREGPSAMRDTRPRWIYLRRKTPVDDVAERLQLGAFTPQAADEDPVGVTKTVWYG
jgi:hypothetical protein